MEFLTVLCLPHPQIGDPHLVICMDCSADTMTSRLRQSSQSSPGASSTAAVAQRLEAYHRASIPVIAYYEAKTRLQKVKRVPFPLQMSQFPTFFFFFF